MIYPPSSSFFQRPYALLTWFVRLSRNTRVLRHHLSEIRKAKDQLDQAMCSLEAYGERPKAFFPDSPVHKAVTADHIVLDSPVRGRMCDVIERWSEAWMNSAGDGVLIMLFSVAFLNFSYSFQSFPCVFVNFLPFFFRHACVCVSGCKS